MADVQQGGSVPKKCAATVHFGSRQLGLEPGGLGLSASTPTVSGKGKVEVSFQIDTMTPEKQQEIALALQSKGALGPCSACHQLGRLVQPEYAGLLFSKTATFELPGPVVTCAIVECQNCGFITLHNLPKLGVKS